MTATQSAPTPGAVASWPPGMPRSLDYPRAPVGSILRAAVRRWGDRTAYLDHDVELTYTELGARAHAVAGWLADAADERSLISRATVAEIEAALPLIDGGMRPKLAACAEAIRGGAGSAHIIDGRRPHSLLLELFTIAGIGTMVEAP